MDIHEGHRPYSCQTCGKAFKQKQSLEKHVKAVHDDVRDFKCERCGKAFHSKSNLQEHVQYVHEGRKDLYTCESCGKTLSGATSFWQHKKLHGGVKNHKCDSCEYSSYSSGDLKNHIRAVHEGIKDYSCESCKTFFTHEVFLAFMNSIDM